MPIPASSRARTRARPPAADAARAGPPAPDPRLHVLNDAPVNPRGAYVLYWCRACRRAEDNLALDHAAARAAELGLGLLVYEALDTRYPHASDRIHAFVLGGVAQTRATLAARGIAYAFFLPRTDAQARASRALSRLAARAAMVVTDWYPAVAAASPLWSRTGDVARALPCRFEAYDDVAVVPMALLQRHEHAARTIRPRVHALLEASLALRAPDRELRTRVPRELDLPFEPLELRGEVDFAALVASCEIDHAVTPVAHATGGTAAARARLRAFLARGVRRYDERNDMALATGSGLSPWLHFGMISPREVARAVRDVDASEAVREGFLEQLVVRRALAFNHCMTEPACGTWAAVPAWARATLDAHRTDPRAAHTFDDWERARTADPLWNAAQRELLREGTIHPYARMLWGKVGITLAATPEEAFAWLVHLNDKYALDGRDPNGYTNIAWCFGLHDMPFPERAVFGRVRPMTSPAAARKWDVKAYLARVGV